MKAKSKHNREVFLILTCCVLVAGAAILCEKLLFSTEAGMHPETSADSGMVLPALVETQQGEASSVVIAALPIVFADSGRIDEYRRAETLESWKLISELPCSDYALSVLESISSQGFELVEAGFMDLSGECWGCVFSGANGESLSVILMPERPFSPRSDTNRLVVNILHYLQPEEF